MKDDEFIFYDEEAYFDIRKESRQERKRIQKKDRSKFKKTDQAKEKTEIVIPDVQLQKGVVTHIHPQQFFVSSNGKTVICSLRGALKKECQRKKNLVIVGDKVFFEAIDDENGVIHKIETRKSFLSRADHLSQQKEHLIAANVDNVLITLSVINPPLRPAIIDRYLIAARKGNLHPIIICNKIDLLDDPAFSSDERNQERQWLELCKSIYEDIGYTFITTSAETKAGIDDVQNVLKDSISVFSGQSGSGKSSIINAATGLDLRVRKTVDRTRKGAHTTSQAKLIPLSFGGFCIDTPGIKSFGVWDLSREDLMQYFIEINEMSALCKYPNCRHKDEPDCAVRNAVDDGTISELRYASYLSLLEEITLDHLRR